MIDLKASKIHTYRPDEFEFITYYVYHNLYLQYYAYIIYVINHILPIPYKTNGPAAHARNKLKCAVNYSGHDDEGGRTDDRDGQLQTSDP